MTVSSASISVSPRIGTLNVAVLLPTEKVPVPEIAVKSLPAVAVPEVRV